MAGTIYLADTTIYVLQGRHASVRRRFERLLAEGRLAGCQLTALEYLNNAPDPAIRPHRADAEAPAMAAPERP